MTHRPLRICLISYRTNPHSGGQGVYINQLGRGLAALGHHVEVLSGPPYSQLESCMRVHHLPCLDLYDPADPFRMPKLSELSDPVNLIQWLGVSTAGFPEPFTFGLRTFGFLKDRCREYDIVHDNQSLSYGVAMIARKIPVVATIHHPITIDRDIAIGAAESFTRKIKQCRWHSFLGMQKRVARAMGLIVTVSKSARRDISRSFAIPQSRFRVVPNGIDTELFRPLPHVPRESHRVIVTNSADIPLKGLDHLLTAVATISSSRSIRLIVVGQPPENSVIPLRIKQLGIEAAVNFTGHISTEEMVHQYARAALAVVPSLYEGFGLPAAEAMACQVPVVSTTGGALPEVVGDAAILVPPANPRELARAIVGLLDNPQAASTLAQAGYHRVRRRFTWRQAARKTISVYREAIDAHRRSR